MKAEKKINIFKEKKKTLAISKENIKKQHDKGKLTAFERIDILLDRDSFIEFNEFSETSSPDLADKKSPRDGVIIGIGRIEGRIRKVKVKK